MKPMAWLGLVLLLVLSACTGSGNGEGGSLADTSTTGIALNGTSGPASGTSGDPGKKEKSNEQVKLVVATYFLSDQVKVAVEKYEQLHPNVDIELHAASTSGKDLNDVMNKQEQFVKTSNTAMLAGKGPDIIELDQLPSEQYVKRGLLVDLHELMNQDADFHKENYFTNIMDHVQSGGDGGLYGMPLYFSLVGLYGNVEAIEQAGVSFDDDSWTLNDFIDTIKQLKQKGDPSYIFMGEERYFLEQLVTENFEKLITVTNGEPQLDTNALAEMMEQVQKMADDGLLHKMGNYQRLTAVGESGTDSKNPAYFMDAELYSLRDALLYAPFPRTALYAKPHLVNAGGGGYFKPFGQLGINANSDHPQEAWDFIQFLLNEESVQAYFDEHLDASPGFPMNRSVYEQQKSKLLQDGTVTSGNGPKVPVDPDMLAQVDHYINTAVHAVGGPSKLSETIYNETEAFFAGQKSASDVAKVIANKINLLLNE